MPLGIAPYTLYLTLSQAASGIQGRWSVEPVPSFTSENKAITGAGTGCAIVAKSSHVDDCLLYTSGMWYDVSMVMGVKDGCYYICLLYTSRCV